MKQFLASFAKNRVFANIVFIVILFAGGLASFTMVREMFPQFSLDTISITVPYPGADPEEVEEGISQKIEEAIEGVEGIKQYTTRSEENVATAMIEVTEDYDVNEVLEKVRSKVNAIPTFPADAEEPIITEMTIRDAVIMLYLSGDMSERRLKEWAERIKDELNAFDRISQVEIFGVRDYQVDIEVSEDRLRQYGLSFDEVTAAVRAGNLNMAGGTIRTDGEEIRLRTVERKYRGDEIGNIVVLAEPDGDLVTLDRVATVRDGFTEDPIRATMNGERSLLLQVYKTPEEDAVVISELVLDWLADKRKTLPPGVTMDVLYDTTDMLRARIDLLVKNGIIGLALVFMLLYLVMDARLSFWVGMGIPISLSGALAILWGMGETINMISLFGLIMVLGIVVDDAIIVGESIFVHRKMGKPPLVAAVDGVSEVGMPVLAAVTTSVVAFLPLAYISGVMGKFIRILPTVVIACLAISLIECLLLLPAHLSELPDPNRRERKRGRFLRIVGGVHNHFERGLERFVDKVYQPFLKWALSWRYVFLCIAVSVLLLTLGLVRGGVIKFEVFPDIDGFVITSNIEFPAGTPPEVTAEAVDGVERALERMAAGVDTTSGKPLVKTQMSIVGQTLGEMPDSGPNLGAVQAILVDAEDRGIHSNDLLVKWEREVGEVVGAKSVVYSGLSAGPPGSDIEVWLMGRDLDDIISASEKLMARLGDFEGVYQIRSDYAPGKDEIRLTLKPEARVLGITAADLATQIHAGYYGEEALRIQRGREDVRIKVRYDEKHRGSLSSLYDVRIRTRDGREVPLSSVADFHYAPGYATITRTDGMRRVSVQGAVDQNRANTQEIFGELKQDFFPGLMREHPGLRMSLEGQQKNARESLSSLKVSFPLAVFGILMIIATMFRSYPQPFIIILAVPFGIIGGVVGHLALGYDLSLMSVFGMVALTGVVVNDAIVLIERINENLAEGMRFKEAVVRGGMRRVRAILLTSVSTIFGLAPLIMETDLQAKFLIPMALSLAAGVAFATVLTLVLVPCLFVILNDIRRYLRRAWTGELPTREDVEPATKRRTLFYPEDGGEQRQGVGDGGAEDREVRPSPA
ncbi:MAG: efflux RND transporter permease subunit [Desulfatibacillaceae bacterium]